MFPSPEHRPSSVDLSRGFESLPTSFERDYMQRLKHAQMRMPHTPDDPIIDWPFNTGVMRNQMTFIPTYYSDEFPGIAIQTPPYSRIRSPAEALIESVKQQAGGLYEVMMSAKDSQLAIVLGNISQLEPPFGAMLKDDTRRGVHSGEVIGALGYTPDDSITLMVAYKPSGQKTGFMLDPLPLLPQLFPV